MNDIPAKVPPEQAWVIQHPDPENAKVGDPVTVFPIKLGMRVPMSTEHLLFEGLITEDEAIARGWTPPPPVPRLRRWRWAAQSWWWQHRPRLHFGPCDDGSDA